MQELKAEKPIESPEGTNPVTRLMERLREEGGERDVELLVRRSNHRRDGRIGNCVEGREASVGHGLIA